LAALQDAGRKGKCQDEAADNEEKRHSTGAVVDDNPEGALGMSPNGAKGNLNKYVKGDDARTTMNRRPSISGA
jgi:hypothetical protein